MSKDTVLHDEVVLLQVLQLPLHVCQLKNVCKNQHKCKKQVSGPLLDMYIHDTGYTDTQICRPRA